MSYMLYPIAVDLDKVRSAIGSKCKKLLATLEEAFAADLEQIDGMIDDYRDEDEEDELPTAADVLRQLIMGEPYREDIGFAYGYCFEIICQHFGERLNSDHWSSMRSEWFKTVEKGLQQAGADAQLLSPSRFAFRGPPVSLPEIDDFPGIGYLTRAEITPALAALAAADLAKVKDQEVREAIEEVRSWFETCSQSGRDLVCTYA